MIAMIRDEYNRYPLPGALHYFFDKLSKKEKDAYRKARNYLYNLDKPNPGILLKHIPTYFFALFALEIGNGLVISAEVCKRLGQWLFNAFIARKVLVKTPTHNGKQLRLALECAMIQLCKVLSEDIFYLTCYATAMDEYYEMYNLR